MAAYMVVRADIKDPERYKDYTAKTPALIEKHGGRFLVRGGSVETLEGREENRRVVIVEFESVEKARVFYQSPEYQELVKISSEAGDRELILVDGFAG